MTVDRGALLAANRRRARLRRILLWIAVPLAVLVLLLPVKLASMYAFAHRAITAHVAGDFAGSIVAAQGQEIANGFEPYKAPYNVGVGLVSAGDLVGGRAKFEEALPLASGLEACAVHINLALTIERMGDRAQQDGDPVTAERLYGEALTVVAETPEECRSEQADAPSPDPQRSAGESIEGLDDRLKDKQQPESSPQPEPEPSQPPEAQRPSEDELQELEEKLQQGDGERQQQGEEESSSPETDRPW